MPTDQAEVSVLFPRPQISLLASNSHVHRSIDPACAALSPCLASFLFLIPVYTPPTHANILPSSLAQSSHGNTVLFRYTETACSPDAGRLERIYLASRYIFPGSEVNGFKLWIHCKQRGSANTWCANYGFFFFGAVCKLRLAVNIQDVKSTHTVFNLETYYYETLKYNLSYYYYTSSTAVVNFPHMIHYDWGQWIRISNNLNSGGSTLTQDLNY